MDIYNPSSTDHGLVKYQPMFKVYLYSHFFVIKEPSVRMVSLLLKFTAKYVLMEYQRESIYKKPILKPSKVFAARCRGSQEFRFHIGQYKDFLFLLDSNLITSNLYEVHVVTLPTPATIDANILPGWVLRDYQEEAQTFFLSQDTDILKSRLATIATGKGKTVLALSAAEKCKQRIGILLLPTYIEKWCSDVTKVLDIRPKEIMRVEGSAQVKGIIELAKSGNLTSKVIIFSINTLQNFYKAYELDPDSMEELGYGCNPDELFQTLGIGTMIVDEIHRNLHMVFRCMLYMHVNRLFGLSATFLSEDNFIKNIQTIMFPKEIRFDKIKMDKYINVYAIGYNISRQYLPKIKTTAFRSNVYSHNSFEESIMKNKDTLNNYLRIIENLIDTGYIENYETGNKLVIFAYRKDLCETILKYLQSKPKYSQFDMRTYIDKDPYENAVEPDIRVSTVISLGTAIDIPNLTDSILTTSLASEVSNRQVLGRLRDLKEKDTRFYYLYCINIPKHVEYHLKKKEMFADSVKSIQELMSPISI